MIVIKMARMVAEFAAAKRFWRKKEGASAIEYALIAGLVAVILIAVLADTGIFGTAFQGMFSRLAGKFDEVASEK